MFLFLTRTIQFADLTLTVLSSVWFGYFTPGVGTLTISGNPLVVAGVYPIDLKVVDPHGAQALATVTITVNKERRNNLHR